MVAPFGFGISDFVAVGQLAWRLYLSCKAAPDVFGSISRELNSLYCVLEEAAETQTTHPLPHRRQTRLNTILDGCVSVLTDLQYVVEKYRSLGTEDKSSWDRLRLGSEDIAEIRSRLVLNITLLTAFRSIVIGTLPSEGQIEQKGEYGSWQWVVELSGPDDGLQSPRESLVASGSEKGLLRSMTDTSTLVDVQQEVFPTPCKTKSRPRLASLVTGTSSSKRRLISAIDNKDSAKALDILHVKMTPSLLDQDLLDHAIWSASRFESVPLMEALLEKGANLNAVREKKSVLWNAVSTSNDNVARFLLSKHVDLRIDHLWHGALPLRAALKNESMMLILAKAGASVDAEYQVSARIRMNILQEAVSQGKESIVRLLLDNGAKVDACSSSHGTALMIALSMGREPISKLLIQKGANVNFIRIASESCSYNNPMEAAIMGRKPMLLELLFKAGAITDMPQAMKFAQANSDYPLIPSSGTQYGYDYDGTWKFYVVMVMLAQRDLRYVCFFRKTDAEAVKREGIRKMMQELCK